MVYTSQLNRCIGNFLLNNPDKGKNKKKFREVSKPVRDILDYIQKQREILDKFEENILASLEF